MRGSEGKREVSLERRESGEESVEGRVWRGECEEASTVLSIEARGEGSEERVRYDRERV